MRKQNIFLCLCLLNSLSQQIFSSFSILLLIAEQPIPFNLFFSLNLLFRLSYNFYCLVSTIRQSQLILRLLRHVDPIFLKSLKAWVFFLYTSWLFYPFCVFCFVFFLPRTHNVPFYVVPYEHLGIRAKMILSMCLYNQFLKLNLWKKSNFLIKLETMSCEYTVQADMIFFKHEF